MPPISNRIIMWHSIKTYLFYKLYLLIRKNLKTGSTITRFMSLIGASIIYKMFARIIDMFFCWLFTMKELSTMDEFFLYDDEKSLSNTCIVGNFTPFEFEAMSAHFKDKLG